MTTVIFVHGTGVREGAFDQVMGEVTAGLSTMSVHVKPCNWGNAYGTQLNAGGVSIPTYNIARNIAVPENYPDDEDIALALWHQLSLDPLFELRMVALDNEKFSNDSALEPATSGEQISAALGELSRMSRWSVLLTSTLTLAGVETVFGQALEFVEKSSVFTDAIYGLEDERLLSEPVARAVVATSIVLCQEKKIPCRAAYDAELRDSLVKQITTELGGMNTVRSLFSFNLGKAVKTALIGWGLRYGTGMAKHRRGALMDNSSPAAGDVLRYQARGQDVRAFIRKQVALARPGPVVLLAHSLGGIACVDALIEMPMPEVKLLITAGSQAPYLYEIDALSSLTYKDASPESRLPTHFPEWLNFYDLHDILSYLGGPVFGTKVTDIEVVSRLAFPQSHSSYWTNKDVWKKIDAKFKQLSL